MCREGHAGPSRAQLSGSAVLIIQNTGAQPVPAQDDLRRAVVPAFRGARWLSKGSDKYEDPRMV